MKVYCVFEANMFTQLIIKSLMNDIIIIID